MHFSTDATTTPLLRPVISAALTLQPLMHKVAPLTIPPLIDNKYSRCCFITNTHAIPLLLQIAHSFKISFSHFKLHVAKAQISLLLSCVTNNNYLCNY